MGIDRDGLGLRCLQRRRRLEHFDQSGHQLVVAVLPGSLRAFDAQSHLLAWSMPVAADGASLLDQGVSGHEFAVFYQSHVAFYDGATRALLREFGLEGPVTAIREIPRHPRYCSSPRVGVCSSSATSAAQVLAASDFSATDSVPQEPDRSLSRTGDTSFLIGAGGGVGVFRFNVTVSKRSSRTASTADVPGRRRNSACNLPRYESDETPSHPSSSAAPASSAAISCRVCTHDVAAKIKILSRNREENIASSARVGPPPPPPPPPRASILR